MFPSTSAILDVGIGIFFIFLLVSLICSQVNDKLSSWLRMRAKGLEEGMYKYIVGEKNFQELLYQNPLITSVIPEDPLMTQVLEKIPGVKRLIRAPRKPVNIPAKTFSKVLFDALIPNNSGQTSVEQLRAAVETLPPAMPLRGPLLTIIATTENNLNSVRSNVETWFDETMTKTTNLYHAHMWRIALAIGAGIAIFLNIDTISIARVLWTDASVRAALVAEATAYTNGQPEQQQALAKLNSLDLPIGWTYSVQPLCLYPTDWFPRPQAGKDAPLPTRNPCAGPAMPWYEYVFKFIGLAITALAGAQGAPFWFDLLKKLTRR
jgi:hypothetical protein